MRGLLLSVLLLLPIRLAAADATATQWGVAEVTLAGPSDGNPFTEVTFAAAFSDGSATIEVPGFYDGDGRYRVRFMPPHAGSWTYRTISNRWPLAGRTGRIEVGPPRPGEHGPVRVFNTYHFAYADGTPYWLFGTTIYMWLHRDPALEERTLRTLAASPFNKVRMCLPPPEPKPKAAVPAAPFAQIGPGRYDLTRFNPEFFRHFERRIGDLQRLGIQADLILFHPYAKSWGFDSMDRAGDERYLRYVVARFSAYSNVWWSLANEYDLVKTKEEGDWDHLIQVVAAADPYGHLRSIHHSARLYNYTHPWVTHASIQNGSAVEDTRAAELYRDAYRKPIVYDEVKYEGDIEWRWGNLSGEEMVHRFWTGIVAGTYVTHGETFRDPPGEAWTSWGGSLHGTSPARIAFLRKIVEDSPAGGIDPIDKWQDSRVGGTPGEYYLIYFGKETPANWPFHLYKAGLAPGMRFHADRIDAWAMTIEPIPGEFIVKQADAYTFVDQAGRSIALPGMPYQALRIRRTGGQPVTPPP
jgi:hypothetical protein